MLDIKFIRDNKDLLKQNCKNRNVEVDIDRLIEVDGLRRTKIGEVEELRAMRKAGSKAKPTSEEIERMRVVGEEIKQKETELAAIEIEYTEMMIRVPNITHPETPIGGEDSYRVFETIGEPTQFDFTPKDHEELLTNLNLIDFERGAKVAGGKFFFSKGDLVRLNQALIHYGIDVVTAHGYELIETPDLARNEILQGIGFNPRGLESQIYSIENMDLSLIGTAEITVGGYHKDEILDLTPGPKKYVALSHCFRTEAGAYGRESKGLYRVHQFTKLEMFVYCKPEDSEAMHQELLAIEKEICDGLGLSYRVIDIASGDLGGPAYRKFDIEAWMTMNGSASSPQGGFGEITSTSNCTDYQARRLNIRYRTENGETNFVHTLNGTAIVTSRFPIAIVEQYQQENGTIKMPEVLQKYLGKKIIG
ncbi:MAG: serine--tRNA ligase [Candidatus Magasanikbacteria bacterium RIFCSPHIGHO2_01_FULL_41_23]|uniref:Serine--tRNA ligase n=1 Tax=Candidatus Magasanikbacteria bacterium RIFCSPLOWO2_01_FULL_40_15 TaxID=1798686 RepID=A0A1F6N307_9BACT|nr:MAG: serine--tRNA ligase [Candidatus Magasanikbacteria bacterium RIFCSPHIGHO2_01_FULL_41_23]OGH66981.1 MAG: serine--tRNA ligase [Candidatus Magasanikbacteria bacterium RIFCSPHIGHO2_02_FULL_41_35]OGH74962.1 MAG: serine--tRNA ligase [Candidatus Magasanikbacteria bacterium RIFCSPHIGHO2_12_FULL_41_16]OGH78264.1 MAG: serine--tRNA ligase [Candidatus Magasanikbacteria bacterium RIFCSPLOWO2_01_FULL_40_15]